MFNILLTFSAILSSINRQNVLTPVGFVTVFIVCEVLSRNELMCMIQKSLFYYFYCITSVLRLELRCIFLFFLTFLQIFFTIQHFYFFKSVILNIAIDCLNSRGRKVIFKRDYK